MNPEDLERQGISHQVITPESGGEKEETKKGEAETKGVIPPKEGPPPKRSRPPRDGVTSPPKIHKGNLPPLLRGEVHDERKGTKETRHSDDRLRRSRDNRHRNTKRNKLPLPRSRGRAGNDPSLSRRDLSLTDALSHSGLTLRTTSEDTQGPDTDPARDLPQFRILTTQADERLSSPRTFGRT